MIIMPKDEENNPMTKDKKTYRTCGATNRKGDPCTRPAGWGTSHPGSGKCKLHGGGGKEKNSGAPIGNKNAEVTGQFTSIFFDKLSDEQNDRISKVPLAELELINNQIKIYDFRLAEMYSHLKKVKDNAVIIEYQKKKGTEGDKEIEVMTQTFKSNLELIQRIEAGITQVQKDYVKAIESKCRILSELNDDGEVFDAKAYVENLQQSVAKIWDDDKGDNDDGSEKEKDNK